MPGSALDLAVVLVAAAEDEVSKTPFYVAGAVLAVWAVVVSVAGMRRADFPPSSGLARGVMLFSGALVVAALVTTILTSEKPEGEAHGVAAGNRLVLAADPEGLLAFDKKELHARPGVVTIAFSNPSPVPHDVRIERGERTLGGTRRVTGGDTSATIRLARGTYTFYCSVAGHRSGGMEGELTVE